MLRGCESDPRTEVSGPDVRPEVCVGKAVGEPRLVEQISASSLGSSLEKWPKCPRIGLSERGGYFMLARSMLYTRFIVLSPETAEVRATTWNSCIDRR